MTPPLLWQHPHWPKLSAEGSEVVAAVAAARLVQGQLAAQLQQVGMSDALIQSLWVDEVVSTSGIEGEVVSPASVRSSVMRKMGLIEDAPSASTAQIDGLVAITEDATKNYTAVLDADRLWRWHAALFPTGMSGVQRIAVGRWRDHTDPMQIVSGYADREVVHYTAPPSKQVAIEMQRFLDWFERTRPHDLSSGSSKRMDGLVRAAIAHLWFESIHPFEDGNGRIGRAIVELAMAQDAHSPMRMVSLSRQILRNRRQYYNALQSAQHPTQDSVAANDDVSSCDVSTWVTWFASMWKLACMDVMQSLGDAKAKAQFWAQLVSRQLPFVLNARQHKVVARLLDDGDGGFLGGMSTEKYAKMTSTSKPTATRDLADLVAAGLLFSHGNGRATRYYIKVTGWTHGLCA